MLVNGTKNLTYDLKINYRFIQSLQFFSNKVIKQLNLLGDYFSDFSESLNEKIGHNYSFYELFLKTKNEFTQLRTQTTLYINTNPSIYEEQIYLNNVLSQIKKSFSSLRFLLFYYSLFFYGSSIVSFSFESFTVNITDNVIELKIFSPGIFNLMSLNQKYILNSSLMIFSKLFSDFYSFNLALFIKLDNRNEYISNLTQNLIPKYIENLDEISNTLQFSYFDLEIIRNNSIELLTVSNKSETFQNRIKNVFDLLSKLEIQLTEILQLL